jgi:hypothetical protein
MYCLNITCNMSKLSSIQQAARQHIGDRQQLNKKSDEGSVGTRAAKGAAGSE